MKSSGPSEADRELAIQASRLGVEATPRQVERWRQEGYLQVNRRGRGRGLGSVAFYPPGSAEHAADLARALEKFGRLDDAALVAFLRGHSIKERAIKRAYASAYSRVRQFLGAGPDEDAWDVASRASRAFSRRSAASETGKAWRARLRSRGKADQLGPVAHDLLLFFLGGEDRGNLSHEVFEAMGVEDAVDSLPDSEAMDLDTNLNELNLPALEASVEEASLSDLERARDQLRLMLPLLGVDQTEDPGEQELVMAIIGPPSILVLGSFLGTALATGITRIQEEMNQQS